MKQKTDYENLFRSLGKGQASARRDLLCDIALMQAEDFKALPLELADIMVENVIGTYSLPIGIASHFVINGEPYLIPMAIEEPSVIKAASYAAQLVKTGGGFSAQVLSKSKSGQIILTSCPSAKQTAYFKEKIAEWTTSLLDIAKASCPDLIHYGGGPRYLQAEVRTDTDSKLNFYTIRLWADTKEAMGANMINTMLEAISAELQHRLAASPYSFTPLMAIISNDGSQTMVEATCRIPQRKLKGGTYTGEMIAKRIAQAARYAQIDPTRALTHNKGIMNGIDALLLATANDWRAVEASVHQYASSSGRYQSLSSWTYDEEGTCLIGKIRLPLPIGTLGGAISSHTEAQAALKILGYPNSDELMQILACLGLAQNLAALRAIVTEGIQAGHMPLQNRKNIR